MAKLIFVLLALALVGTARADISDSGNLTIGGQGIIQGTMTVQGNALGVGGSITATTFSSAPVILASTISAPGSQLNVYTDGGNRALVASYGSNSGLRLNIGTFLGSQIGNLEVFNTGGPTLYFRRNDTSVSSGETLGGISFRDSDTSTGGSSRKAYYENLAEGTWGSGQTMEQSHRWGLSRGGGTAADYMVLSSTGLLITPGSGSSEGTLLACSTCALQVVGNGNFSGSLRQGTQFSCTTGVQTDADGVFSACVASDASLKKNVQPLAYVPSSIDLLRPVTFEWKDAGRGKGTKQGFIAQDVEKVYPNAVVPAGTNLRGIDSNAMLAALVLEVQELRKRIAVLETKR